MQMSLLIRTQLSKIFYYLDDLRQFVIWRDKSWGHCDSHVGYKVSLSLRYFCRMYFPTTPFEVGHDHISVALANAMLMEVTYVNYRWTFKRTFKISMFALLYQSDRSIVPLASNATAVLRKWGFWLLGKVEELSTWRESSKRTWARCGDGSVTWGQGRCWARGFASGVETLLWWDYSMSKIGQWSGPIPELLFAFPCLFNHPVFLRIFSPTEDKTSQAGNSR